MILHCVFCNFRQDVIQADRLTILGELADFAQDLDGVRAVEFGRNLDFEHKSPDHGEGFVIRFDDEAAAQRYAVHPVHKSLGSRLCDMCTGGADGIIVYDLAV